MTKKDYQAIAGALYRVTDFRDGIPYESTKAEHRAGIDAALRQAINNLADVLAADDPRFDRERFVTACETGDVTRRPKRKQTPAPDGETPLAERLTMAKRKPRSYLAGGRASLPLCVKAMGCYCAGHAQGNPITEACDTRE